MPATTFAKPVYPILRAGSPLTKGLVLALSMHEGGGLTAYDLSGRGNSGSLNSGVSWADSPWGKCLSFDGSSGYGDFGNVTTFTNTPGFSIAGWFCPSVVDGNWHSVISKVNSDNTNRQLFVGVSGGYNSTTNSLVFFTRSDSGDSAYSTATLTAGRWYHFVATHLGTGTTANTIYLDGQVGLNGFDTGSGGGIDADGGTNRVLVGRFSSDSPLLLSGYVGTINVWSRALSSGEAASLYADSWQMYRPSRLATLKAATGTPPAVASVATANSAGFGSADVVISKPSGTVSGDLLVALISIRDYTSITPPAGWTLIGSVVTNPLTTDAAYWKAAGGSEPSTYTWSITVSTSDRACGAILRITEADTTTPINAQASASYTGDSDTDQSPAVTTTAANCLILLTHSNDSDPGVNTVPTGATEQWHQSNSSVSASKGATIPASSAVINGPYQWDIHDFSFHFILRTIAIAPFSGGGATRWDRFTRANNSGPLGTPSDGGSAWLDTSAIGGGALFGINGNQAYDAFDSGGNLASTLDSGSSDTAVQVTLATFADQMGLSARATDSNNYLFIRAYSGLGYDLFKRVAGASTNLGSYSTTPASGDVLKLDMSGSSLTVYVNGVSRITATDGFNSTATKHGLWAYSANFTAARWDNFSITDLGGGGGPTIVPQHYYPRLLGGIGGPF